MSQIFKILIVYDDNCYSIVCQSFFCLNLYFVMSIQENFDTFPRKFGTMTCRKIRNKRWFLLYTWDLNIFKKIYYILFTYCDIWKIRTVWSSPQEANRHIETGGFTSELILLFISNLSLLTNEEEGRIGRVTLLEIWFTVEGIDDDVSEGKVEECNSEGKLKEKGINIEDGVHDNLLTVEPWEYKVSIVPNK